MINIPLPSLLCTDTAQWLWDFNIFRFHFLEIYKIMFSIFQYVHWPVLEPITKRFFENIFFSYYKKGLKDLWKVAFYFSHHVYTYLCLNVVKNIGLWNEINLFIFIYNFAFAAHMFFYLTKVEIFMFRKWSHLCLFYHSNNILKQKF